MVNHPKNEEELIEFRKIMQEEIDYAEKHHPEQTSINYVKLLVSAIDDEKPNFLQILMKGFEYGAFGHNHNFVPSLRKIMEIKYKLKQL